MKLFFLLCALPMLGVFPYFGAINNPNENVRTYMTMAIVEQGSLRIDESVARFGWVNDMALVPQRDLSAAHYSVKAPATSLVGVPGYWLFSKVSGLFGSKYPDVTAAPAIRVAWLRNATWACRLFAVQIPCFLFLIWLERYLRAFSADPVLRLAAVAAAGLGTNYLAYTHMFASHATFAIAAFGGFALVESELRRSRGDARARRPSRALLAGFLIGWSVVLEYHALPVALLLALYGLVAFWRPTRLLAFGIGGSIAAATLMLFQWKAFGNAFTPGHKMVENARFAAEHHQGLFGILMPDLDHVRALSFDLGFGFFGTSPFMVLGLVAIPVLLLWPPRGTARSKRRYRLATLVWVVAMMSLWLVNSGFIQWRAGWTVGPRYLGAAPPFFAFGALCMLERVAGTSVVRRAVMRGVAAGLALASVLTIGTVGLVYDTLPESIQRPLAQFSIPMAWTGYVPHHVGEWFGWTSTTPWYLACAGLLLVPIYVGLLRRRERGRVYFARVACFLVVAAGALVPAFTKPEDGTALLVLHPDTRAFPNGWEPPGRDRISVLRNEAERYGPRRPCMWYHLADLERVVGAEARALQDEARAGQAPRDSCPKRF